MTLVLEAPPMREFRPLSEEAYDVLRAAILSGRLPPGARLVEADIARQMATSRSPVREAVRKLEREGMVEYKPRRGTVVVGLSRDDVADAYQLRAHLEGLWRRAGRDARARRASLPTWSSSSSAWARAPWWTTCPGWSRPTCEFHRSICAAVR